MNESKKTKIFIDGSEGTTGLRIYDRLKVRDDVELLSTPYQFLRYYLPLPSRRGGNGIRVAH